MQSPNEIVQIIKDVFYLLIISVLLCSTLVLCSKLHKSMAQDIVTDIPEFENYVDYREKYSSLDDIVMIKFIQKDKITKVYTVRKSGSVNLLGYVDGKINSVEELKTAQFRDYRWTVEDVVLLDHLSIVDSIPTDYETKPFLQLDKVPSKVEVYYDALKDYSYLIGPTKNNTLSVLISQKGQVEKINDFQEERYYFKYDGIIFERTRRIVQLDN